MGSLAATARRFAGRTVAVVLAAAGGSALGRAADDTVPCPRCLVWRMDGPDASALETAGGPLAGLRVMVDGPEATLRARALAAHGADAGARVDLAGEAVPDPLPAWIVLRAAGPAIDDSLPFRLKALASELRARRDDIRIGLDAPAAILDGLAAADVAAYVDCAVAPAAGPLPAGLAETWRHGRARVESLEAAVTASPAGGTVVLEWPGSADVPLAVAALAQALGDEPVPVPGPPVRCLAADRPVPCRVHWFLDVRGDGRQAWIEADEPVAAVRGLDGSATAVVSLERPGAAPSPSAPTEDAPALGLEPPSRSFVVRLAPSVAEDPRFRAEVQVTAERPLTAAEILARHRAADQRQRRHVTRLISTGDTTITFTLPGLSAPASVTARTILYDDGARREVEQQDLRWNGAAVPLDRRRVPRLPIVEPAAAEPPLALRLDEAYTYTLAGRETVEGRPAYVLAFAARQPGGPQGRAWIDAADFGLSRLHTVRAGLPGPVVSSEQLDSFTRTDVAGRAAWLLSRSEIHQTYEGPGHRTPIHRLVRFEQLEANPADFQARRARAHAGTGVLMRETSDGFRYLAADPVPSGERRPAGRSDSVRTVALGVTLDPNVDGPLPFGGIGYLDLDLFGTGAQVNAFLGAGFVQGSFTVPRLGGSRWQLQGSLFAVLVRYNDRSFREGVEDYQETLRQRPSRASLGVSRPLTARSRVRVTYELEHNALGRSDLTATDFVAPVAPLAHGLRLELEARRGAWTGVVFGSASRRTRWEPWGRREALVASDAGYQRYGLTLGRTVVATPRATGRVEAAWQGGHGLDRFSRYAVDSFLNRLRGYPSGSLRYDRGLLLRGQASAHLRPGLRAELFLDAAFLHDPGYGDGLRPYPGLGLGLTLALPRGALLAADGGWAFQGRDREGRKGTQALQVTLVKTF